MFHVKHPGWSQASGNDTPLSMVPASRLYGSCCTGEGAGKRCHYLGCSAMHETERVAFQIPTDGVHI